MRTLFLAVLSTVACLFTATAQTTYYLTLEEAIEIAKKQSITMQNLELDRVVAENNLKSSLAHYRTNVSLSTYIPNYSESVKSDENAEGETYFYAEKKLRGSADLNITQPLPTDGSLTLSTQLSTLEDYANKSRTANFGTRLSLNQPLEAFYGYNSYKASVRTTKLNYESSVKSLKRAELNLIYSVSSSYYSLLLLQKQMEIRKADLDRQTEGFKISGDKLKAELIKEVEYLQLEVDLAQSQNNYDLAVFNFGSSTNSFKNQLGLELEDSVVLMNELQYREIFIDPEKAVDLALRNRLEIQERDIQIEQQEWTLKQRKSASRPSASLTAYYDLSGVYQDKWPSSDYWTMINNSYDDAVDRAGNFGVGLRISIPIFNWGNQRSQINIAEARYKQAVLNKTDEERNIEIEVRNLVAKIQSALRRLQLLERNVVVAEKGFAITASRFEDGDIDAQALSLERDRLNQAYTSHLDAYINYQLSLSDLTRNTFYDFENDVPIE